MSIFRKLKELLKTKQYPEFQDEDPWVEAKYNRNCNTHDPLEHNELGEGDEDYEKYLNEPELDPEYDNEWDSEESDKEEPKDNNKEAEKESDEKDTK